MPSPIINPAGPDFSKMKIQELQAEAHRLADVLDLASRQRLEIFHLIEKRKMQAITKQHVRTLGTIEKDALLEALRDAP